MAELTRDEIYRSLRELNRLCRAEYDAPLLEVMDNPAKLRRLGGLTIKRPFATPMPASPKSATGARRSWAWNDDLFDSPNRDLPEFQLLDSLRAWRGLGPAPRGFEVLAAQVETERGLFKVAASWLQDRLRGRETKSLREYYGAAESARVAAPSTWPTPSPTSRSSRCSAALSPQVLLRSRFSYCNEVRLPRAVRRRR